MPFHLYPTEDSHNQNLLEFEEWKPVLGFEGYYSVSNLSRVKSEDRLIVTVGGQEKRCRGAPRSAFVQHGYKIVPLWKDNKSFIRKVHRLVLEAFRGPRPAGMVACHNDGNPLNNHIDNLRWDTPQGNSDDQYRHGTKPLGSRCSWATLNEQQVRDIRTAVASGTSQASQARKYGVSSVTIHDIVHRVNWAWLE